MRGCTTVLLSSLAAVVLALGVAADSARATCKVKTAYKSRKQVHYKSFLAYYKATRQIDDKDKKATTELAAQQEICVDKAGCKPGVTVRVGDGIEDWGWATAKGGVFILRDFVEAGSCVSKLASRKVLGDGLSLIDLETSASGRRGCDEEIEEDMALTSWQFLFDMKTQRFLVGLYANQLGGRIDVRGDAITVTKCGDQPQTLSVAALRKGLGWTPPPDKPTFATSTKGLIAQGRKFAAKRHLSLAITAYRKAIAKDAKNGSAWAELGYALYRDGQLAAALDALTEALPLKTTPGFRAAVQFNLGLTHDAMGHSAKAKAAWEASHAIKPTKATREKLRLTKPKQ